MDNVYNWLMERADRKPANLVELITKLYGKKAFNEHLVADFSRLIFIF